MKCFKRHATEDIRGRRSTIEHSKARAIGGEPSSLYSGPIYKESRRSSSRRPSVIAAGRDVFARRTVHLIVLSAFAKAAGMRGTAVPLVKHGMLRLIYGTFSINLAIYAGIGQSTDLFAPAVIDDVFVVSLI